MSAKPPVLITGAGGFLGAWLMAGLMARGERVWGFDLGEDRALLTRIAGEEKAATVGWTKGDVTDADVVEAAFEQSGAGRVVHLAALTIPACRRHPARGAEVNLVGHINILEAARSRGLDKVLYTSSIAAHPRGALQSPANLYGVFKRAVEDISKVYYLDHGLASIGLRPNVVYGLGRGLGETAVFSEAIRAAAEGRPYVLPFDGKLCFQHVEEIVEVMIRCLDAKTERPLVSDVTLQEETVGEFLAALRRAAPEAEITASEKIRPKPEVSFDNRPLRALIGDWPHIGLEEGIARTLAQHRKTAEAPA